MDKKDPLIELSSSHLKGMKKGVDQRKGGMRSMRAEKGRKEKCERKGTIYRLNGGSSIGLVAPNSA